MKKCSLVKWTVRLCFVALVVSSGVPLGAAESEAAGEVAVRSKSATERLETQYPSVIVHRSKLGTVDAHALFAGTRMTAAPTPEEAADAWLAEYAIAMGAEAATFKLQRQFPLQAGRFEVFHYGQNIDGLPVEYSRGRVLALEPREDDPNWRVVYAASGAFTTPPADGFPGLRLSADDANQVLRRREDLSDLDEWMPPKLVVLPALREGDVTRRVWKVAGRNSDKAAARSLMFFVDAVTAEVVHERSEIHNSDLDGTITGWATPGTLPDVDTNLPEEVPLVGVTVTAGGESQFSDTEGNYLFDLPEVEQTVEVTLDGEWVNVIASQGTELVASGTATPPSTLSLVLNDAQTEFGTSQVNAFLWTERTHDFFSDLLPDFDGIDVALDCFCNLDDACNAFFDTFGAPSINFFAAGTVAQPGGALECANTGFSSVVSHEYGHFIVNEFGLVQNAFGEGYSDVVSIFLLDDPVVGTDFFGPGTFVRDIVGADQQYPCGSPFVHTCGQVLAGVWWDIRLGFEAELGVDDGPPTAHQLFADWSAITTGQGFFDDDAADPQMAVETLIVNDDDGELDNGTPDFAVICDGYGEHSIDCPEIPPLTFSYPDGIPSLLLANGTTEFTVVVGSLAAEPSDGTGTVFYSVNGAAFESAALTATSVANEYTVSIPVEACGDLVTFYLSAETTAGDVVNDPLDAPTTVRIAGVGDAETVTLGDSFETDLGWTVGDDLVPDDATTGAWERVAPIGTEAAPGVDVTPDPGTFCYVTEQGSVGGGLGEADVDGGKTTLVSPLLDLSEVALYLVSYYRWFSNDTGASPNFDEFFVDISNDGGLSWVNVETVGPGGAGTSGGWIFHSFNVADFVEPTDEVRVRFVARDLVNPASGTGSLVEAGVDEFTVRQFSCLADSVSFVRADCNGSGVFDISDPIYLLEAIFGGGVTLGCEDACDADDNGITDFTDVFGLLAGLFTGGEIAAPFPDCGVDSTPDSLVCETPDNCL